MYTVMAKRKRSEHYVNNKEFLAAIVEYKKRVKTALENDQPKPRITNYLGECFLKIATHLSFKPNFVQYINNFDPEKSSNPFAYFTQIIHYAFLRRIQKEKKQLEIKTKIIEKSGYSEVFSDDGMMAGSESDYNTIKDNINYRYNNS